MDVRGFQVPGSELVGEVRAGRGPLVVFLHSGVCDRRSWAGVLAALPPDVATLTYDRRGFGDSPLGTRREFRHLDDLREVLTQVSEEPVVLVGSSMGGGLAIDAALELPDRVAALVLLAPSAGGAPSPTAADLEPRTVELDEAVDAAVAAGDLEAAVELDAQLWLDGPHRPAGHVSGAARDLFLTMDGTVLRGGGDGLGASGVDAWSRLSEIEVPVTIATGDLDCGYLLRRTAALLERIPGARRDHLPGTAHLPYLEAPELVARLLARTLPRNHSRARDVVIPRGDVDLAGHLHLPPGFDPAGTYPALVTATPGSSVKEQIAANYAARLAERGFVVLTFDPAHQGASGGTPRDLEDPAARVADLRFAVDFLTTLDHVDDDRIGILGICAGGGYAVNAAMTEHRFKAVGVVTPSNVGAAFRRAGTSSPDATVTAIETVGARRTAAAHGEVVESLPWLPDTVEQAEELGITDVDTLQAVRFYRTARGFHDGSTNRRHFSSDALLLGFDAFHLVEELLTQPVQVIVGGRLGTTFAYVDGLTLFERARAAEDFLVIDGAGHYELYDEPRYVDQAVERLAEFYSRTLS